jgi:hypothetical protein
VIDTLRSAIAPHVDEPFAAVQTRRLIGLAMYARDRGVDPTARRQASIAALIGDDDATAVLLDPADPRAPHLRKLLVEHLDADIAAEAVLLGHFHPEEVEPVPSGPDSDGTRSAEPARGHDTPEPR